LPAYEYLIVLEKVDNSEYFDHRNIASLSLPHSHTAGKLAENAGYSSVHKYFKSLGID
jgi:hypothetical protein